MPKLILVCYLIGSSASWVLLFRSIVLQWQGDPNWSRQDVFWSVVACFLGGLLWLPALIALWLADWAISHNLKG